MRLLNFYAKLDSSLFGLMHHLRDVLLMKREEYKFLKEKLHAKKEPHSTPNNRYLTYTELHYSEADVHLKILKSKLKELVLRHNQL